MARTATALILGLGLASCSRGPKSPEQAFAGLARAVQSHDAEALYEVLDQDSRWAWMTVQRCQREAYDVVLSNFPQGADREAKLRHLEPGATAESAAVLFARVAGATALASLDGRVLETPAFERGGSANDVTTKARIGDALAFRLADGRWGYAGFALEAADRAQRATADLEMVKLSATDYERAAVRGGK